MSRRVRFFVRLSFRYSISLFNYKFNLRRLIIRPLYLSYAFCLSIFIIQPFPLLLVHHYPYKSMSRRDKQVLLSWLSVCYMALIRATALVIVLYAKSVAVYVFISEFLAFAAVYYLTHCYTPFHSSLSVFGRT